ncbi:hypothetical protein O3P69_016396 [Scylla paramamosain]|uniref:Uncharacterized protein n=1 Tax=Scylla paramamosain TaxID=85552 RepID=A0AAW0TE15_SCYPA
MSDHPVKSHEEKLTKTKKSGERGQRSTEVTVEGARGGRGRGQVRGSQSCPQVWPEGGAGSGEAPTAVTPAQTRAQRVNIQESTSRRLQRSLLTQVEGRGDHDGDCLQVLELGINGGVSRTNLSWKRSRSLRTQTRLYRAIRGRSALRSLPSSSAVPRQGLIPARLAPALPANRQPDAITLPPTGPAPHYDHRCNANAHYQARSLRWLLQIVTAAPYHSFELDWAELPDDWTADSWGRSLPDGAEDKKGLASLRFELHRSRSDGRRHFTASPPPPHIRNQRLIPSDSHASVEPFPDTGALQDPPPRPARPARPVHSAGHLRRTCGETAGTDEFCASPVYIPVSQLPGVSVKINVPVACCPSMSRVHRVCAPNGRKSRHMFLMSVFESFRDCDRQDP